MTKKEFNLRSGNGKKVVKSYAPTGYVSACCYVAQQAHTATSNICRGCGLECDWIASNTGADLVTELIDLEYDQS